MVVRDPAVRPHPVNRSRRLRPEPSRRCAVSESRQDTQEQEPIGIVISRGRSVLTPPRLSAYIYGVAEESNEAPVEVKAA